MKQLTEEEIEKGHSDYQRELRRQLGDAWYFGLNWDALLPDPWKALQQRKNEEIH